MRKGSGICWVTATERKDVGSGIDRSRIVPAIIGYQIWTYLTSLSPKTSLAIVIVLRVVV